jgi:predicted  nucleic acid-binding Zn-ribbon protein
MSSDDNSDLNVIARLERQENFDENLEDIHAALSKRDSIRQSSTSLTSSNRSSVSRKNINSKGENDDEKDGDRRKSVNKSHKRPSSSRRLLLETEKEKESPRSSSSRRLLLETEKEKESPKPSSSRRLSLGPEKEKQSPRPQRKNNSRQQQQQQRRSSRTLSLTSNDDLSPRNVNGGEHRRNHHHRQSSRRRISQQDDNNNEKSNPSDERPVRTASVIEQLLQYDGDSVSPTNNNTDKNKSNSYPLSNPSTSRDSIEAGKRGRRSRSSRMLTTEHDPQQEIIRHQHRQRGSSQQQRPKQHPQHEARNHHHRRSSSQSHQNSRKSESLRSVTSQKNHHHEQGGRTEENRIEKNDGLDPNQQFHSRKSLSTRNDNNNTNKTKSIGIGESLTSSPGRLENVKKTKLEKIHELLGKCDRYKKEWKDSVAELRKCQKELENSHSEVVSLKKNVETYERATSVLQTELSEALDELETIKNQQRKERTELSDTARDLARANIDHAKSVDEARTLKAEFDRFKETLADRDGKISTLEEELRVSVDNTKHLEADVLYADDQINKLEKEIKTFEEEVAAYRDAAERDSTSDTNNGDKNGENLREAMNEATKCLYEQKEKNLDEKRRMLEEEMEEFEEKRRQHLVEQKHKVQVIINQQDRENEKHMIWDDERRESEEKIYHRLKTLEDENGALNGRLKSEQLDSTMKFKSKDNTIAELQTEVTRLTGEQQELNNAPDSSSTLLKEIASLKRNAELSRTDFEDAQMKKVELQNEVNGMQLASKEMIVCVSTLKAEIASQKKEVDYHKRKTTEWQKKSGEWCDKASKWKDKAEQWESKANESNPAASSSSSGSADTAQVEPQALFLAAAVQKKATAANGNGSSWRDIFTKASENEDETQAMIGNLENENSKQESEIKTLKSEMVKMQSKYKEQAYNKKQHFDQLLKEKEAIELTNANLLEELELARKMNQIISSSDK